VRSGDLWLHMLDHGGSAAPLVVLPEITSPANSMDFVARELTDLVRPIDERAGRGPYPTTLEAFLCQLEQAQRGTDADEVARSRPRWPRRGLRTARAACPAATRWRSRRPTPLRDRRPVGKVSAVAHGHVEDLAGGLRAR
jgi:hypothetical protein